MGPWLSPNGLWTFGRSLVKALGIQTGLFGWAMLITERSPVQIRVGPPFLFNNTNFTFLRWKSRQCKSWNIWNPTKWKSVKKTTFYNHCRILPTMIPDLSLCSIWLVIFFWLNNLLPFSTLCISLLTNEFTKRRVRKSWSSIL